MTPVIATAGNQVLCKARRVPGRRFGTLLGHSTPAPSALIPWKALLAVFVEEVGDVESGHCAVGVQSADLSTGHPYSAIVVLGDV